MAQIGSFVPAKKVNIGITDKIFTRVGADNISQSLHLWLRRSWNSKSLILLDEIITSL